MANYQIYQEGGTYYLAVRTERNGEPNIWTQFNYLYVNPVTPLNEDENIEYSAIEEITVPETTLFNSTVPEFTFVKWDGLFEDSPYELKTDDNIKITKNGIELTGYFFGKRFGNVTFDSARISFKPPLADTDLGVKVSADGFFVDDVVLTRTKTITTYSKQEMRQEPVRFLKSGGNKVVRVIDGKDHWLIKMPEDFIIDQGYQPGVNKPKAEEFNIGGSTTDRVPGSRGGTVLQTRGILPFIAKRAFDYAEEFTISPNPRGGQAGRSVSAVRQVWAAKVAELMAVKY
jgi:hypothetical protein